MNTSVEWTALLLGIWVTLGSNLSPRSPYSKVIPNLFSPCRNKYHAASFVLDIFPKNYVLIILTLEVRVLYNMISSVVKCADIFDTL